MDKKSFNLSDSDNQDPFVKRKRLIVIDSNSVIHRAYHALPRLTTKGGELVNAVYGFLLVFLKAIKEFHPDYIIACFDYPAITFRHKKFEKYKAKRPPAPEDLYQQIPKVKEILEKFSVPIFEKEGFEADDIIGTISKKFPKKQVFPEVETIILSGDLDTLQLVDKQTKVYLLRKGVKDTVLYNEDLVKEKYEGLTPDQLIDFKALRGDPSDNIPGVTGVGEKTAVQLVKNFNNLENLYKKINEKIQAEVLKPKLREILTKYKDQAFLSRELVKIEENVPIELNLDNSKWGGFDKEKVVESLKSFEFYSLIDKLPDFKEKEVKKELRLW